MMRPQPKPVIVISSHVARGSVGNRAAVFSLEVLGHPVWAIPTLILPFHPGHGKGTRIVPENNQFADLLEDLADSPWITEVGGILTGYMANAEQAIIVAAFIRNIREKNPALLHICDPVMGDQSLLEPTKQGRLYIGEETAMAIKHHLCDGADMLTPNRFELSWLVGKPINSTSDAIGAAGYFPNKRLLGT